MTNSEMMLLQFVLVVIGLAWIVVPFAVFGIKRQAEEHTKLLESIERHLKFQNDKIRKQEHETLASL